MIPNTSNNRFYFDAVNYSWLSYNPATFKKLINKTPDWSAKNILIVEDDETNAYLLKAYLKKTRATIIEVRDGKKAVEICKSNLQIDLILMDIRLPIMNGYKATKLIKEFRKDIPIIAQTAYALKADVTCAKDAGCDDFLAKPISQEQLFTTLSKYI
jgi:CheY-like chemotaxis protein